MYHKSVETHKTTLVTETEQKHRHSIVFYFIACGRNRDIMYQIPVFFQ